MTSQTGGCIIKLIKFMSKKTGNNFHRSMTRQLSLTNLKIVLIYSKFVRLVLSTVNKPFICTCSNYYYHF